jgi:predicted ABC-type ATPase
MPFFRRSKDIYNAESALERVKLRANDTAHDLAEAVIRKHVMLDATFQFIGAGDLPCMDVGGNADPYFIATIDDKMKFM